MQIKLGKPFASTLIYPLACALAVIGAKCWMIGRYGNPTPFWDQWDAEGVLLYPRYLGGTLQLADLIAPHNEHRILMTRLWSLLLLELEGYWDPILQMLGNTLIFGGLVALLVAAFRPLFAQTSWIMFAFFSVLLFSLPLGWGTSLEGFNSQWYFMLLFGLAGLVAVTNARAFALRWWVALLLLIAGYFSMAGGTAAAAAAFSICALQMICARRSGASEWLALIILLAVTGAMALAVPVLAHHAPLKAHSAGEFLEALIIIMSWPAAIGINSIGVRTLGALILYAPALLTIMHVIKTRPPLTDRSWFLAVFAGWMTLAAAALAYGRAATPIVARELDLIMLAMPLNFGCLLYLLHVNRPFQRPRLAQAVVALWLIPVCLGTAVAFKQAMRSIAEKRDFSQKETRNLRAFLDTGDIGALTNKPELEIPYPDPKRLAAIASSPVIRALLPPELVGAESAARAQQRGVARYTGHAVEAFKNLARRWGVILIPIGLLIFALSFWTQFRRAKMDGETSPHA